MKKILVCCATSSVTSTYVVSKLKKALQDAGVEAVFTQCKFNDVPSVAKTFKPDIIVPTAQLNSEVVDGIPVIVGTALIAGVGAKPVLEKIIHLLKD